MDILKEIDKTLASGDAEKVWGDIPRPTPGHGAATVVKLKRKRHAKKAKAKHAKKAHAKHARMPKAIRKLAAKKAVRTKARKGGRPWTS